MEIGKLIEKEKEALQQSLEKWGIYEKNAVSDAFENGHNYGYWHGVKDAEAEYQNVADENDRLKGLINTPHTDDFLKAVPLEAAHQIERWGTAHDDGKAPTDWLWLVGYLAGKAVQAALAGDIEKAKHHTISTSAVMLNWYRRLSGEDQSFQPGIVSPDSKEVSANA